MSQLFTIQEIHQIIADAGPIMRLHPEEKYLMDHPDPFLASGLNQLQWGIVLKEDDYDSFSQVDIRTRAIADANGLKAAYAEARADARSKDPNFRKWIHVDDSLIPGKQDRAKALVCVRQRGDSFVDLQFFFFYGFNGPGKARVTLGNLVDESINTAPVGRHYCDLEHVTLRVARSSEAGRNWKILAVYLSRHDLTHWVTDLGQLDWYYTHPIIYIARDSHAHYEKPGTHYYKRPVSTDFGLGTFAVDLFDLAGDGGIEFRTAGQSEIIFSNVAEHGVQQPAWWEYDGRWGQYERLKLDIPVVVPGQGVVHIYPFKEVGAGPGGIARFEYDAENFRSITAGIMGNGLQVFGIGNDKNLYHSYLDSDGWWHPWTVNIPGVPLPPVEGISIVAGNVFAIGLDGTLYQNWLSTDSGWHQWVPNFQSAPRVRSVVGAGPRDALNVFAVGEDGTLYQNWLYGNQWHHWTPNFQNAPRVKSVATAGEAPDLNVFAVGLDGTLHQNWLSGGSWHRWTANFLGAPPVQSVCVAPQGSDLNVFAVGPDGTLYQNWLAGGQWHQWTPNFQNAPRVKSVLTVGHGGDLNVFAVGLDGTLYQNWLAGGQWHQWTPNFQGAPRVQSVAAVPFKKCQVFAIGMEGTLYHNYLDQAGEWHRWVGPFTR